MERVRRNIELIIERLNAIGYIFGIYTNTDQIVPDYIGPHNPPKNDIAKTIAEFESLEGIGAFPLSLRKFWEIVGDVNFTGYHSFCHPFSDPLIVYPLEVIKYDYLIWQNQVRDGDIGTGQFGVPISPDYFHKDNMSGGSAYKIRVPNCSIDGIVENERFETTFVNYLRISFRYGGFPGVHWHEGVIPKEISDLKNELIPM